jgi:hypothetical protein
MSSCIASHLPPPENEGGGAAATASSTAVELRGDLRGYRVEELDGGHATPRIIL